MTDTADFRVYISGYFGNSLANAVLTPKRSGECRLPSFRFFSKTDTCTIKPATVFIQNSVADDQLLYKRYNPDAFKKDSVIAARKKEFYVNKNSLLDSVKSVLCTLQTPGLKTDTSVYIVKKKKKTAAMIVRYYASIPCLYTEKESKTISKPSTVKYEHSAFSLITVR